MDLVSRPRMSVRLAGCGPVAEADIELRPLTLLFGDNRSGKSAAAKTIAHLIWQLSEPPDAFPADRGAASGVSVAADSADAIYTAVMSAWDDPDAAVPIPDEIGAAAAAAASRKRAALCDRLAAARARGGSAVEAVGGDGGILASSDPDAPLAPIEAPAELPAGVLDDLFYIAARQAATASDPDTRARAADNAVRAAAAGIWLARLDAAGAPATAAAVPGPLAALHDSAARRLRFRPTRRWEPCLDCGPAASRLRSLIGGTIAAGRDGDEWRPDGGGSPELLLAAPASVAASSQSHTMC